MATSKIRLGDCTSEMIEKFNSLVDLVNYVEPKIVTLELDGIASSYELKAGGVEYTLKKFFHKETNIENIDGNLSFKKGEQVLLDNVSPTEVESEVELTKSDYNKVTENKTITYSLVGNGKNGNEISHSVGVTFYYASYIGANENANVNHSLISSLTKVNSASLGGTRTVTVSKNGYIWFITTKTINKITSAGFDVPFSLQKEAYDYNGGKYNCYRTENVITPGTDTYSIS